MKAHPTGLRRTKVSKAKDIDAPGSLAVDMVVRPTAENLIMVGNEGRGKDIRMASEARYRDTFNVVQD